MPGPAILHIRQSRRACFRALTAELPAVLLVRDGTKRVRWQGAAVDIGAGFLGVLPARTPITIENCPPPNGAYTANALVITGDLLDRLRRDGLPDGTPLRTTRHDRAVAAFERAATCLDDPLMPERLREHAVREVMLWMAEDGIGFGEQKPPSFSDRLRTLLSAEPETAWRAGEAARALAVSEATLRRRLSAEGANFGDLLIDVRMSHALGLLQTTTKPVNHIALDVGYASASRFAVRFRKRFGIAPSEIRHIERIGPGPKDDRVGTQNDRSGTA
jgi:AraC-like DNA-binding protein